MGDAANYNFSDQLKLILAYDTLFNTVYKPSDSINLLFL